MISRQPPPKKMATMSTSNHFRAFSLYSPLAEAERRNLPGRKLLLDVDVEPHVIMNDDALIDGLAYFEFLKNCKRKTRDNLFSFRAGLGTDIAGLGFFGKAMLCSPTLNDALEHVSNILQYVQEGGGLFNESKNGRCTLHYTHNFKGFPYADDIDHVTGAITCLLQHTHTDKHIDFELCFPSAKAVSFKIPGHTVKTTSSKEGMISFDEGLLNCRMPLYGHAIYLVAKRFHIFFSTVPKPDRQYLRSIVENLLLSMFGAFKPSIENVVKILNSNERQLQRRLEREGTTFRAILQQARKRAALEMITSGSDITEVALTLGYDYPGNFTAAFREWYGHSPSKTKKMSREAFNT